MKLYLTQMLWLVKRLDKKIRILQQLKKMNDEK